MLEKIFSRRLIAWATFLTGLASLVRPVLTKPAILWPLVQSYELDVARRTLNVGVGLILIYLAFKLWEGNHQAWRLSLTASVSIVLFHLLLLGFDTLLVVPILLSIVLIAAKDKFNLQSQKGNWRLSLAALLAGLGAALAYGTIGFFLIDHGAFHQSFGLMAAVKASFSEYFFLNGPAAFTRYGHWFLGSLNLVGFATLGYAFYLLYQPARYRLVTSPKLIANAKRILEIYGGDYEDFFKLWPADKSYFWGAGHDCFIAYRVLGGVAISFGDPAGNPRQLNKLIADFTGFCHQNGWQPAFVYTKDSLKQTYQGLGFCLVRVGQDAMIDVAQFVATTAGNKYFRNIHNRFKKLDYETEYAFPPHSRKLMHDVAGLAKKWQKLPGKKEWRFFSGYFERKYIERSPLFLVRDTKGQVAAFVNLITSYEASTVNIDLIRRLPTAVPNTIDFLFMSLIDKLAEQKVARFNLGFAMLGNKEPGKTRLEKVLIKVYGLDQGFISFRGLRRFKAKYEPAWQDRYVAYQENVTSPIKIAAAVLRAMNS